MAEILFSVRRVYSWVAARNSERIWTSSRSGADFMRAHNSRMRSSMRRAGGIGQLADEAGTLKIAGMVPIGDTGAGVGTIGEAQEV